MERVLFQRHLGALKMNFFFTFIFRWERLGYLCVSAKIQNLQPTWILFFSLPPETHHYLYILLVTQLGQFKLQLSFEGKQTNLSTEIFMLFKSSIWWRFFSLKEKGKMRDIMLINELRCCVGCTPDVMDALINFNQSATSCPFRRLCPDVMVYTLPAENIVPL